MLITTLLAPLVLALAPSSPEPAQDQPTKQQVSLPPGVVAMAPNCQVTLAELDELLIWRHGLAQSGKSALRGLLELGAIEHLAAERGVQVTQVQLNERWAELEQQVIDSGEARDMAEYLLKNHVERATFRRYLSLGIIHEEMVRQDLEMPAGAKVPGETQKLWLEEKMTGLGYEPMLYPWKDGLVARMGPVEVTRDQLAEELRAKLPDEELADASYELLLEQRLRARMPDLASETMEAAVDDEVARRRASVARDVRYKGAEYEQLLAAQGLSIQSVRHDPAVRAAALSHLWINRTHDDEALRQVYEAERPFFDGQFGAGVEAYVCLLHASDGGTPLIPRTFEEADTRLRELAEDVRDLATFQERVVPVSDDKGTREAKGLLGLITSGRRGVPEAIRKAIFVLLNAESGDLSGRLLGPIKLNSGMVLVCLGKRQPAPTWSSMSFKVHTELRRRHISEVLPRGRVVTLFDPR
ncbi:MAG: hypothetical protein ACI8QC_001491 [Planctomycetota bacterium]|jgi:hypothetical protein